MINSKYWKRYNPLIKKNKDDVYGKHHKKASKKDKDKAKLYNSSFAN